MSVTLIEILGDEPVTLDQAKRQCNIGIDDDDSDMEALLSFYTEVARGVAEDWTWRGLINANYRQTLDCFPDDIIEIERSPLHDIERLEYINQSGEWVELDASEFIADSFSSPGRIEPVNSWPQTHNRKTTTVKITFEGGYEMEGESGQEISTCPKTLQGAILMLIKLYYDVGREAAIIPERSSLEAVEVPFGVRLILDFYSLRTVG